MTTKRNPHPGDLEQYLKLRKALLMQEIECIDAALRAYRAAGVTELDKTPARGTRFALALAKPKRKQESTPG